ncbi:MAG: hypothetical protein OXF84_08260 [Bacteroidetes bacterium]|nr:hypothetical protein [Bacteroidota bacterium]
MTTIFIAVIVGCDSGEVITDPPTSSIIETYDTEIIRPSMTNGRIVFNNSEAFRAYMESIIDKEDSHLDFIESEIDFESLRSDSRRLSEELEKKYDEMEVVEDPYFASVLNPDGEFQIGEMVYRVAMNYVYGVSEVDASLLQAIPIRNPEMVVFSKKNGDDPVVDVFEIQRADLGQSGKIDLFRRQVECEAYYTNIKSARRRVKGQAWFTNWTLYMSAFTELEYQKKGWIRWSRQRTTRITLNAEYSIKQTVTSPDAYDYIKPLTGSYSHTKYNASEIRKNITWGVSYFPMSVSVSGWISSEYEAYRSSDRLTRSCTTYIKK